MADMSDMNHVMSIFKQAMLYGKLVQRESSIVYIQAGYAVWKTCHRESSNVYI